MRWFQGRVWCICLCIWCIGTSWVNTIIQVLILRQNSCYQLSISTSKIQTWGSSSLSQMNDLHWRWIFHTSISSQHLCYLVEKLTAKSRNSQDTVRLALQQMTSQRWYTLLPIFHLCTQVSIWCFAIFKVIVYLPWICCFTRLSIICNTRHLRFNQDYVPHWSPNPYVSHSHSNSSSIFSLLLLATSLIVMCIGMGDLPWLQDLRSNTWKLAVTIGFVTDCNSEILKFPMISVEVSQHHPRWRKEPGQVNMA